MKLNISPGCINCFYFIGSSLWMVIDLSFCFSLNKSPYVQIITKSEFRRKILDKNIPKNDIFKITDSSFFREIMSEIPENAFQLTRKKLVRDIQLEIGKCIKFSFSVIDSAISCADFVENNKTYYSTSLSCREREVLQLISRGFSSKEIAERLSICLTTVLTHRKNLLEKLEVKNTAELVRRGFESSQLSI